ncbi:RcnB family protein [Acinetobacter sp. S40]|uniref:RcnB family protein n=1 Tax=Acinetobacter sp. S40 TaxID=2767434 RepID=UPI00190B61E5|nr:RcnB family protein [Acinetobacter sp. S40]MBJ9985517.1 RcnB family protein [Acinetobacter sp. S40]
MKRIISVSLCVCMLGASTLSLADAPSHDWGGQGWGRYHAGPDRHADWHPHEWRPDGPLPPRMIENRYYYAPPPPRYYRVHDFRPGYRLPPQYLAERYYVNNWYDYQLPSPPPQHRWAYIDGRYVLVAVATGIIAQILLGGH